MSWEPYVQTLVEGGFHHACIAGHNGSIWATTSNFKVLPKEIVLLCKVLNGDTGGGGVHQNDHGNESDDMDEPDASELLHSVQQHGFTVQGRAYAMNRFEPPEDDMSFLIGRCKTHGSASRGVVVARTAQTIIIGVHDPIFAEGISFGRSNVALFQLAETLTSMNF